MEEVSLHVLAVRFDMLLSFYRALLQRLPVLATISKTTRSVRLAWVINRVQSLSFHLQIRDGTDPKKSSAKPVAKKRKDDIELPITSRVAGVAKSDLDRLRKQEVRRPPLPSHSCRRISAVRYDRSRQAREGAFGCPECRRRVRLRHARQGRRWRIREVFR